MLPHLASELLEATFQHLDLRDLACVRLVCHEFDDVAARLQYRDVHIQSTGSYSTFLGVMNGGQNESNASPVRSLVFDQFKGPFVGYALRALKLDLTDVRPVAQRCSTWTASRTCALSTWALTSSTSPAA